MHMVIESIEFFGLILRVEDNTEENRRMFVIYGWDNRIVTASIHDKGLYNCMHIWLYMCVCMHRWMFTAKLYIWEILSKLYCLTWERINKMHRRKKEQERTN